MYKTVIASVIISMIQVSVSTPTVSGQPYASSLVYEDVGGNLVYGAYANEGEPNEVVHILPDWSYCGYMGGGVALPEVPVVTTISPGTGDDTAAIQAAIDFVGGLPPDSNGIRGAVLLTGGRYQVAGTLFIAVAGVILRGEGQDELGTILELTTAADYDGIRIGLNNGGYSEIGGTARTITSPYVPVGSVSFDVSSTSGYAVGDEILIERTPNQFWIDDLDMGQWGWTPSSYTIRHERRIVGISGNTITVNIPIVDTMEDLYGGGRIFKSNSISRINKSGVEDLRIESNFASDTDEVHPWDAVRVQYAEDCWVRRVTAFHFAYSCVNVGAYARRCTIQDCAYREPKSVITGGRRYSFNIESTANRILFQRCISQDGRHDFVTGSRVVGPDVWVDCRAYSSHADSGPHHRWATGLLFDNIYDNNSIKVQNRESSGSGHGWSGAQVLFWNCKAGNMVCDAPKGAMNYAIGALASQKQGDWAPGEPFGIWEHLGQTVTPRSLYYRQLEERLGMAAVEALILPEQQVGNIWDMLLDWNGDYALQTPPIEPDEPADESLVFGGEQFFEVVPVTGVIIQSYQWYEVDGSNIFPVGENLPILTLSSLQASDEGRSFFCRVVTNIGPFRSRTATLRDTSSARNIIVVTGDTSGTGSGPLIDFLTNEGFSLTVDQFDTDIPDASILATHDLIIIGRESNSGDFDDSAAETAAWNTIGLPVINLSPYHMRGGTSSGGRWGWMDGTSLTTETLLNSYDAFFDPFHPFLDGVSSTAFLTVAFNTDYANSSNNLPAGATVVATLNNGAGYGVVDIPAGSTLFPDRYGQVSVTNARFVHINFGDESATANLTADGKQLLLNVICALFQPRIDITGDGQVNLVDFGYLNAQWGTDGSAIPSADIVPTCGDGIVGIDDLMMLAQHFLETN